jgi:hydroxymethylbilane synthase
MPPNDYPIFLATRGSALAMVQTNLVQGLCRALFPQLRFEIKIIKTTGDKLQTAPPDLPGMPGTKGLFTKELEVALLNGEADLAVHSLKDLPTELPDGLDLRAVLPRADVRDVLIYRDASALPAGRSALSPGQRGLSPGATLKDFPTGALIATSSTRRQAQLLAVRPDLKVGPIRGNVGTRLQKLTEQAELDGLVLAAAGLNRLRFSISDDGRLCAPPDDGGKAHTLSGLLATFLSVDEMIPCVGQGAIGLEGRKSDDRMQPIFAQLNDTATWSCVTAERAFLHAMGGGCLSPVAAHAQLAGGQLRMRAVSFRQSPARRTERSAPVASALELGAQTAQELKIGETEQH